MKRIIFFFMAFMCLLTQKVSADVWDGTSVSYSFESGIGTEDSPYIIANSAQFAFFLNQVRSGITYQGKYVLLTSDIETNGNILTVGGNFAGTFNGGNRTINKNGRIFETLSGALYNLKFCTNSSTSMVTTVSTSGIIYNIYCTGTGSGSRYSGMICYTNNGRIQNCYVKPTTEQTATWVSYGGIEESCTITETDSHDSNHYYYYNAYACINNGLIENCCSDVKKGSEHHTYGRYDDNCSYTCVVSASVCTNNGTITGCYYDIAENQSLLNQWVNNNGTDKYSMWSNSHISCPLIKLNNTITSVQQK